MQRAFSGGICVPNPVFPSRRAFQSSSQISAGAENGLKSSEGGTSLWVADQTAVPPENCTLCISSAAYFGEKAKNSIGEQPPSPSTRRALLLGLLTLWCSVLAPLVAFSSGLVGLLKLKPLAGFRACADAHGFIFKAMDVCNYLECEHMLSPCERKAPALNEIYSSKPEIN